MSIATNKAITLNRNIYQLIYISLSMLKQQHRTFQKIQFSQKPKGREDQGWRDEN